MNMVRRKEMGRGEERGKICRRKILAEEMR